MKIIRVGLLYFIFGFICILGNFFFIFVVLLGINKFKNIKIFCRFLVKNSWAFFIWLCKFSKYLKYEFNAGGLGKSGELIVANHPSLLDVVLIISKVNNLNCVVKGSLIKNPFLMFAIKACGYIANTNNQDFLDKSIDALHDGESLLIFPEGTRTKNSINFHKAAFFIAIKSAKTITPITIHMSKQALKKEQSWFETPDGVIKYKLLVKDSLVMDDFLKNKADPIRVRALQNEIMKNYEELK